MTDPRLFDVHTHVHFAAYQSDMDAVVQSALDEGIWMVNVGTQRDTSRDAIALAERYESGVYAAVGLHPTHTGASHPDMQELKDLEKAKAFTAIGEEFDYDAYKTLALHPKVVAIGECGLDYYRLPENSKEKQKEVFVKHIALAREAKKPLMIHCRNAFGDLVDVLLGEVHVLPENSGVIHFFSGTVEDARKLLDLGFYFSFGGVVTFTRDYDAQVSYIPMDRILLETDAPYVAPVPYRGKRNEPKYIGEVAKKIAEIKNVSFDDVALQTTAHALHIFGVQK